MKKSNITNVKEFEFPEEKLIDIQSKFEGIVASNMALESLAKDAYKAYIFEEFFRKIANNNFFFGNDFFIFKHIF